VAIFMESRAEESPQSIPGAGFPVSADALASSGRPQCRPRASRRV
jgi:hypothetical protein